MGIFVFPAGLPEMVLRAEMLQLCRNFVRMLRFESGLLHSFDKPQPVGGVINLNIAEESELSHPQARPSHNQVNPGRESLDARVQFPRDLRSQRRKTKAARFSTQLILSPLLTLFEPYVSNVSRYRSPNNSSFITSSRTIVTSNRSTRHTISAGKDG